MVVKLTWDVLESYLQCKYKGYLKLTKQYGTKSDDERLLTKRRSQVRGAAIEKLLAHYTGTHLRRDTVIPQWFQASKATATSDGHAMHC